MPCCPPWAARPAPEPGVALAEERHPLSAFGVELIGANLQAIRKAEDRRCQRSDGAASAWRCVRPHAPPR